MKNKMLEGLVKEMKDLWRSLYSPLSSDVVNPQLSSPTSYQSLLVSRIKEDPRIFNDYKGYLNQSEIRNIKEYWTREKLAVQEK